MMKKFLSVLMSFVLLLLSTNTTYGAHYCGGELVKGSILLGKQQLSCAAKDVVAKCGNSTRNNLVIKRKKCCENKYASIESGNDYQGKVKIAVPEQLSLSVCKLGFYGFSVKTESKFGIVYIPPPVIINFQTFFQVFRI